MLKHCTTEFMKHVLPRLRNPVSDRPYFNTVKQHLHSVTLFKLNLQAVLKLEFNFSLLFFGIFVWWFPFLVATVYYSTEIHFVNKCSINDLCMYRQMYNLEYAFSKKSVCNAVKQCTTISKWHYRRRLYFSQHASWNNLSVNVMNAAQNVQCFKKLSFFLRMINEFCEVFAGFILKM